MEKLNKYSFLCTADLHMSNTLPYAKVVKNGVTDRLRDQIKVMRAMFTKAASENNDFGRSV